jgi:hypothetical protein
MTESTPKHARDMTPEEYATALSKLRRGPATAAAPLPTKHARELTEAERAEWLRDYKRKLAK